MIDENRKDRREDAVILPFVQDGHERALDGIRAAVQAKYAQQMVQASGAERKALKKKIEAEIREVAKRQAPASGNY